MTDSIFMVVRYVLHVRDRSEVVKTVTNEEVTAEELAAGVTTPASPVSPIWPSRTMSKPQMRRFMNFLPANNWRKPPGKLTDDQPTATTSLDTLVPDNPEQAVYDMKELIVKVVDDSDFFESAARLRQEHHHRLWPHGWRIRSVSSPTSPWCWPAVSTSSRPIKAARFVRFCDAFGIPVVTFVDVPGFMPGTSRNTAASSARRQIAVRFEATVPRSP